MPRSLAKRSAVRFSATAPDAFLARAAVAGHMSRRMLEHYSHVRMAAKRAALDKLENGLMGGPSAKNQPVVGKDVYKRQDRDCGS